SSKCSARSKVRVPKPAWRYARSSTQRTDWSSSTTQTSSSCAIVRLLREREADEEHRPAGPAFELDQAPVACDEVLRHRQAQPGAVRPPGDERIEHGIGELRRNAGTVVLDL